MSEAWPRVLHEAAALPFLLLPLALVVLLVPALQVRAVRLAQRSASLQRWLWLPLVPLLVPRLFGLDAPFTTGADSFRVLQTLVDVRDAWNHGKLEHLFALDSRHPPLFYWLSYPILETSIARWGFDAVEPAARLVPALAGVLGVFVLFDLVRDHAGGTRALLVAVTFATNAVVLREARNVSDASLFVLLTLWSLQRLLRAIEAPSRRNAGWLLLANTLLFYGNFMALPWFAAELVVASLHARTRAHRLLWASLGLVPVLALPVLATLWGALAVYGPHQMASEAAHPILQRNAWAAGSFVELALRIQWSAFGLGDVRRFMTLCAAIGTVVMLMRARASSLASFLVVLPLLALLVVAFAPAENHMREEYFAFLLAPLYASAILGITLALGRPRKVAELSGPALVGRAVGWSAALLFVLLHVGEQRAAGQYDKQDAPAEVRLGRRLRARGASRVIVAFLPSRTLLIQYALHDPIGAWRATRGGDASPDRWRHCTERPEHLCQLLDWRDMQPGWERLAVERWRQVADRPHHFVYTTDYPAPPLLSLLEASCEPTDAVGPLTAFRCPGRDPARGAAPSAASDAARPIERADDAEGPR